MDARVRVAIAIGGACGSLGRVAVASTPTLTTAAALPWTTLLVNLTGTLALAVLAGRLHGEVARAGVLTGALGAWTTVSALAFEVGALVDAAAVATAAVYVAATLGAGLLAAGVGRHARADRP